jgi:hypothetical protein
MLAALEVMTHLEVMTQSDIAVRSSCLERIAAQ